MQHSDPQCHNFNINSRTRLRSRVRRALTPLICLVFITGLVYPVGARCLPPLPAPLSVHSVRAQTQQAGAQWITPRGGTPYFVMGANYEGPTDRAWLMWQSDKFDRDLIAFDFAKARSLGINTLRI